MFIYFYCIMKICIDIDTLSIQLALFEKSFRKVVRVKKSPFSEKFLFRKNFVIFEFIIILYTRANSSLSESLCFKSKHKNLCFTLQQQQKKTNHRWKITRKRTVKIIIKSTLLYKTFVSATCLPVPCCRPNNGNDFLILYFSLFSRKNTKVMQL